MSTTLNKLEYLDETKQQIKTALNTNFNSQITDSDTFRSYVSKINTIYTNWPKVTGENTLLTLNNTKKGKLTTTLKGNTSKNLAPNSEISNLLDYANVCSSTSTGEKKKWWDNVNNLPRDTQIVGSWIYTGDGTPIDSVTGILLTLRYTDNSSQTTYKGSPFTIPSSKTLRDILVYGGQDTTSNKWTNIQFEEGSSSSAYQPYGYVTGNNTIKIENNLIDINNPNVLEAWFGTASTTILATSNTRMLYVECKPNVEYVVKKRLSARFAVGYTEENSIPQAGQIVKGITQNNSATEITKTTSANAKYLCVFYYLSTADTLTPQQILDSIIISDTSQSYPINIGDMTLKENEYFYFLNGGWFKYNADTTSTQITDTTLIGQLDAMNNAVSYDTQTNISQTNANLPFIISASALKKGGN